MAQYIIIYIHIIYNFYYWFILFLVAVTWLVKGTRYIYIYIYIIIITDFIYIFLFFKFVWFLNHMSRNMYAKWKWASLIVFRLVHQSWCVFKIIIITNELDIIIIISSIPHFCILWYYYYYWKNNNNSINLGAINFLLVWYFF